MHTHTHTPSLNSPSNKKKIPKKTNCQQFEYHIIESERTKFSIETLTENINLRVSHSLSFPLSPSLFMCVLFGAITTKLHYWYLFMLKAIKKCARTNFGNQAKASRGHKGAMYRNGRDVVQTFNNKLLLNVILQHAFEVFDVKNNIFNKHA